MLIGPCSTLGLLERLPLNCSITGTIAPKLFNFALKNYIKTCETQNRVDFKTINIYLVTLRVTQILTVV